MGFELREHTADIEILGRGGTVGEAFAGVADGMAASICEEWPTTGDRFAFSLTAERPEALLFDYLDELIYRRDVDEVLPVDNEAEVSGSSDEWVLEASFRGVPLHLVRGREIKAPTYADMEISKTGTDWQARAVLDV